MRKQATSAGAADSQGTPGSAVEQALADSLAQAAAEAQERLVERMWAPPAPPRRGPRPGLSLERIVDAAFELADTEGLEALSMARLGKALGVSAMALYRHVSSKDELLALLADRMARDLEPIGEVAGWRDGLAVWTRRQISMILEHPWFLDLPLSTVMPGPNRLRWIDQLFAITEDLPLRVEEKFAIAGLLAQHVLGQARIIVEAMRAPASPDAASDPFASLGTLLVRYADPADFPHLLGAITSQGPDDVGNPMASTYDPAVSLEEEIAFGLDAVLDGLEAYVARRAAEGS